MANKLDMSLDDIGGGGRRGGRNQGGGRGRGRRQNNSSNGAPLDNFVNPLDRDNDEDDGPATFAPERRGRNTGGRQRASPYSRGTRGSNEDQGVWRRDLGRNAGIGGGSSAASTGPKKLTTRSAQGLASKRILITNLDSEVTEDDVRDIFGEVGDLTSVVVNADTSGNSKGTANVTFANPSQAASAVTDFDGAEVDGRPMFLRLVDAKGNLVTPKAAEPEPRQRRVVQQNQRNGGSRLHSDSGGSPFPRGGGGGGGGSKESLFGSALDDLDSYDDSNNDSFSGGGSFGGRNGGGRRGGRRGSGGGGGGFGNNTQRQSFRGGGRGGSRGGGKNKGRGGGKNGGKNKGPAPTQEGLDAEMDAYFNHKDNPMVVE